MKIFVCIGILITFVEISLGQYTSSANSQPGTIYIITSNTTIREIPAELFIKDYVENKITEWQKKGEFEKTVDYKNRVNEISRQKKAQKYAYEGLEKYKEEYAKTINLNSLQLGTYDADNETFLIHSDEFGDFALPVAIESAPDFKKHWESVLFQNIDLDINTDGVQLSKLEFFNPNVDHTYVYDSQQSSTYAFEDINYTFSDLEYNISITSDKPQQSSIITNRKNTFGYVDVDINVPMSDVNNTNAFALIIGNEDYRSYQTGLQSEQNVYYAVNDALVFKKYCEQTLGIPRDNIIYITNAGVVRMTQAFNQVQSVIKNSGGEASIIVYYAGHGFPDPETNEPYLIPVDVTGTNLEMAIKLKDIYSKLTEFPSKSVTVFLDACFSGGGRDAGLLAARSVKVKPKDIILKGNLVVFSASTAEQSSLPYHDKQHGLFTYYLLKKLQETKGDVILEELSNYVEQQVSVRSPLINAKDQNPQTLVSPMAQDSWMNWKLKP